ncbi:MAG: extradiol dioxygenase [Bacteroidota bacterium]
MTQTKIPSGIGEGALVGHISVATICTTDLESYKKFYGEIAEMEVEAIEISESEKSVQRGFWHIPADIDYGIYHFYRAAVPSLIRLRVLHLKIPTPHIHHSYNSYELGSFSLGFPTSDAKGLDKRMQEYGVGAMAPMQKGDINNPDGSVRHYLETIYHGPDFLHVVGIERIDYPQLAPCDPKNGFGGPGYSAFVAKDSDAEAEFYTKVLEYSMIFDSVWETAEGSALGVEAGVPFRFAGMYAPNTKQNHFLLLEFKNGKMIDTGVPSHLPNQGLGMYSLHTTDIEKVLQNARDYQMEILSPIQSVKDAILGEGKVALLKTPNGFYIEIFEAA